MLSTKQFGESIRVFTELFQPKCRSPGVYCTVVTCLYIVRYIPNVIFIFCFWGNICQHVTISTGEGVCPPLAYLSLSRLWCKKLLLHPPWKLTCKPSKEAIFFQEISSANHQFFRGYVGFQVGIIYLLCSSKGGQTFYKKNALWNVKLPKDAKFTHSKSSCSLHSPCFEQWQQPRKGLPKTYRSTEALHTFRIRLEIYLENPQQRPIRNRCIITPEITVRDDVEMVY